jgi:hypothetical protein
MPASGPASADGYTFRRPRDSTERRYKWIAVTDDGTRIGLGGDPVRFYHWRGVVLDGSILIKEAKGNSRDAVVAKLLHWF